ncbi:MAG TPA: histidine kinase dimerization/phospho-acceptor domain-containing protein, partial [Telluria sp.]|nr:histidine kinase dimerization/phospho-acceptor domain-containing protein [Telluria sp.]
MGRLFWKFFLSILLAQITATIGIGTVFWLRERAFTQTLDTSPPAEFMLEAAAATLKHGGRDALRELVSDTRSRSIYALDENGSELLGRSVSPELLTQAERALANGGERQVVRKLTDADGHSYLMFLPRDASRGAGPKSELRHHHNGPGDAAAQPPDEGQSPAREARPPPDGPGRPALAQALERRFHPLAPMTAAILASLLFAALLAWYFSRPIRALRSAFEAASAGDLTPRFGGAGSQRGDELSDLGRDFDRMSGQLHMLMDGQRRLLHDVSHELRSPLARLQAAIGLAHQQPDKAAVSLERIERESIRMDKLVGELLTLSRLEASAALPVREDIPIMDMIEEIAGDARFEAEQCNRSLAISGCAVVNVR